MELVTLVMFFAGMVSSVDALMMSSGGTALVTHEVFFDISVGGRSIGRIVLGLFNEVAPKTVENFLFYSTQQEPGTGYKNSIIHRVVKGHALQGGDFLQGDGTGETSIYGESFEDESFVLRNHGSGWLGMANKGRDSNSCQFFITFKENPGLDGRHVIFGKVLDGMGVARSIENVETNDEDRPIDAQEVRIINCGQIPVNKPFSVSTRSGSDEL